MDYRKVAIRILFSSLGVAALSGVLAMILPNSGEVIGRLIGTAIATAVSAAILLLAIQRFEVQTTRVFGAGLGLLVLVVYGCTLITTWVGMLLPFQGVTRGLDLESRFGLTALLFAGCGSIILTGLLFIESKRLQLAGYVLASIWAISLIGWLLIIWIFTQASHEQFLEHLLYPLQTLFPLLVLACIRRHLTYMVLAIAFAVTCCVSSQIGLFLTNGRLDINLPLLNFILITGGISAILGIASVIQFRKAENAIRWLELLSLLMVSTGIMTLCISIWFGIRDLPTPELLLRLAVGTSILSSTAIIAVLIGQTLRSSVFSKYDGVGISGICPRCRSSLTIPRGKSQCPTCGLRMKLQIESPHCRVCGYDSTKTPSNDVCSECGEPIAILTSGVQ
jgi:hypothetical protein